MMQAKNHDRSTAMWALELLGSPAALDRVVDYAEGFKKEKDINAFNRFFKTLDSLKKNAAAEAVFPLLRERDYKRRAAGVAALAALASENSRECLVKMLADEHWFVRGAAAEGLGNIGNRLSAPNLIGVLSDRSWYVRRKAVLALVKLKASGSAAPLLKVFKDKNISVQEEAARALSEIADLGVADKMMAGLRKRDSFAWRYCMEYLGKVKVKKAVPVLIKVLSGGFWSEKVIAAESLGNIGDKRAIKPLKRLLKDNSAEVHMAAEKAIRQISEPKLKAFKYLYDAKIR